MEKLTMKTGIQVNKKKCSFFYGDLFGLVWNVDSCQIYHGGMIHVPYSSYISLAFLDCQSHSFMYILITRN